MWGQFKEVSHPEARRFVHNYWRFLLGWGPPPRGNSLPLQARRLLRIMARTEFYAYRNYVKTQKGVMVYVINKAKCA